jgi:hypothetical protein
MKVSSRWKTDAELLEKALPANREINKGVLSLPRGRSTKRKENEKDGEKHGPECRDINKNRRNKERNGIMDVKSSSVSTMLLMRQLSETRSHARQQPVRPCSQ